jgi:hypothetical protein
LTLDIPGINQLVEEYDRDSKALKDEIFKICWYMRGMPPSEAFMLTAEDRIIISKIVEGNFKTTKESGLPFF